jgi:uncharacterized paraquat-inducible protein A
MTKMEPGRKIIAICALGLGAYLSISSSSADQLSLQLTKERANFPHQTNAHSKLECSRCHTVSPAKPDVEEFPGHGACTSCHNLALEGINRPVAFCGICHNGRPISKQRPALFNFPKRAGPSDFGSNFSHPSHLKPLLPGAVLASTLKASFAQEGRNPLCTDCHKRTQPIAAGAPDMTIEKGHSVCYKCHGQQPIKPPSMYQCAECHKLGGPRSPHLYGLVKGFKHEDHDYDIRPKKKAELVRSKPADYLCIECHDAVPAAASLADIRLPAEDTCNRCHNGRIGLPDPLKSDLLEVLRRR